MANRFFDTNFYKSPFVRGLKGPMKGLYTFIICDCSSGGVWVADFEIATVYIGASVSMEEFKEAFVKSGKAIDLLDGNFFFPSFIKRQYPKGLSASNPAHTNVILELRKHNLIDESLKVISESEPNQKK